MVAYIDHIGRIEGQIVRAYDGGVEPGAKHEGADQLGESRTHDGIAGAEPRLDEGLPFPGSAELIVVRKRAGQ